MECVRIHLVEILAIQLPHTIRDWLKCHHVLRPLRWISRTNSLELSGIEVKANTTQCCVKLNGAPAWSESKERPKFGFIRV